MPTIVNKTTLKPEHGFILAEHSPEQFRTRQIQVTCQQGKLHWLPVGDEISFSQMQALREQPCKPPADFNNFQYTLANLGVSVRLQVQYQGKKFELLIAQKQHDGLIHKLISGYVDSEHLGNPFQMVLQEISEEILLINNNNQVLNFTYKGQDLSRPYKSLEYVEGPALEGNKTPAEWYIHTPTNSLQLVWHLNTVLPDNLQWALATEEFYCYEKQRLITQVNYNQPLIFVPDKGSDNCLLANNEWYQLAERKLTPMKQNAVLSEYFYPGQHKSCFTNALK